VADLREWTLTRGVQPPVVFVGELIAHHDGVSGISLWQSLVSKGRWHAISVFKTREGRFVVYICFRTRITGEVDNREIFDVDAAAHLAAVFAQYQQIAFPVIARRIVGDQRSRQRDTGDLVARFQAQVASLLAGLPEGASKLR
jgi:hypothetical protein